MPDFARMIIDTFDTLWAQGDESPSVMSIAIHPYNMGQPHRIRHLDAALRHIMSHDKVWKATGAEIADWYYQHFYDTQQASDHGNRRRTDDAGRA